MESLHLLKVKSAIKDGDVVLLKSLLSEKYETGLRYTLIYDDLTLAYRGVRQWESYEVNFFVKERYIQNLICFAANFKRKRNLYYGWL